MRIYSSAAKRQGQQWQWQPTNACSKLVLAKANSNPRFGQQNIFMCNSNTRNIRHATELGGKRHCNSVAIKTKVRIRLNIRCRAHKTNTNNIRVLCVCVCGEYETAATDCQSHHRNYINMRLQSSERPLRLRLHLNVYAILLIQRPKSHCASWAFFVHFYMVSETTNMYLYIYEMAFRAEWEHHLTDVSRTEERTLNVSVVVVAPSHNHFRCPFIWSRYYCVYTLAAWCCCVLEESNEINIIRLPVWFEGQQPNTRSRVNICHCRGHCCRCCCATKHTFFLFVSFQLFMRCWGWGCPYVSRHCRRSRPSHMCL